MRIQDDDGHSIITFFSEDSAIWVVGNILMVMKVTRRDGGYRCSAFNRDITDGISTTSNVTVLCK